jgi:hypothetical protein
MYIFLNALNIFLVIAVKEDGFFKGQKNSRSN